MKKTAIISFAFLVIAAVTADAQYQRKAPISLISLVQLDFYKNPEREHIQNDTFLRIDDVEQLPAAVRNHLGRMANPGEHWWHECAAHWDPDDTPVPSQRLIFAAMSYDHLIVYYETDCSKEGVFAIYSFPKRDFFQMNTTKDEVIVHRGGGSTGMKVRNVDELKAAILASRAD